MRSGDRIHVEFLEQQVAGLAEIGVFELLGVHS
jgi:hypothetical protein